MGLRNSLAGLSISPRGLGKHQALASPLRLLHGYSPFPVNVDLVLTVRCNFACEMCVCRQEGNAPLVNPFRETELSLDEWKEVVDGIAASFYFRPNMNLLGGEPSIYRGYLDLARHIKQSGFRCSYTTNGTFLARDADEVVSAGVDVVVVSIDGQREVHDGIRGIGAFQRATEGIRAIQAQKAVRRKPVPNVFLACTVNRHNHEHLTDVIGLARELNVPYVDFMHLQFYDSEPMAEGIDVEALIAEMERVAVAARQAGVRFNFTPPLRLDQVPTYYSHASDHLGRSCISPWLRMTVMPNGKIVACRGYVVGDASVDGTTIRGVWNGHRFVSFRRAMSKPGALKDCGRCCRKQY